LADLGVAAEASPMIINERQIGALGPAGMGLDPIQPDGSLPVDMNHRRMALHYHLFALGPLAMLAELGEVMRTLFK
jgi:poly(beta-D-mannuronate) lyase